MRIVPEASGAQQGPANTVHQPHVVIIYTDAGGGHKATAEALRDILEANGAYRVTLVNPYREIHPHLDVFARWTRRDGEQVYNELVIGEGRTGLFCLGYYGIVMLSIRLQYGEGRRTLSHYLQDSQPDLVISVLPLLNQLIVDSLPSRSDGTGKVPCAVVMTDWMEMKRQVWFPKVPGYYAICGTEAGYAQARERPYLANRLYPTSGLLVRPAFLDAVPADRAAALQALGLEPHLPVACMLYGGGGSWRMWELAQALRDEPPLIQVIFLCGRNTALAQQLESVDWPFPVLVRGFTPEVHRYLGVSDVFIGKPGPGSVSEALAVGLSLLLDRKMVLPQERPQLRWLEQEGLGQGFADPAELRRALGALAAGETPAAAHRPNRAALEFPDIVAEILAKQTN